jgi:hypothetical protein
VLVDRALLAAAGVDPKPQRVWLGGQGARHVGVAEAGVRRLKSVDDGES